jgi:hypothetical protein
LGDGVLVYFGYPQAHEDDAERAVRAGLGTVEAVGRLDTPAIPGTPALGGRPSGDRLEVRIGIATGLVVVGDLVGEGAAQEQAVVGETPNLAARLQALAEPGSVVIAAATRRLIGDRFRLQALGRRAVKGLNEPVEAWAVEGVSASEGRFEAVRSGGLTGFVGREHELGLLLERWNLAQDGEGQVVPLSGEPGIGKSRILNELRGHLETRGATSLRFHCSPYHVCPGADTLGIVPPRVVDRAGGRVAALGHPDNGGYRDLRRPGFADHRALGRDQRQFLARPSDQGPRACRSGAGALQQGAAWSSGRSSKPRSANTDFGLVGAIDLDPRLSRRSRAN